MKVSNEGVTLKMLTGGTRIFPFGGVPPSGAGVGSAVESFEREVVSLLNQTKLSQYGIKAFE